MTREEYGRLLYKNWAQVVYKGRPVKWGALPREIQRNWMDLARVMVVAVEEDMKIGTR